MVAALKYNGQLASRLVLHVLTDHSLSRGRDLLTVAKAALDGGATVLQLRHKTASTRTLVAEGVALRALTRERGALLIVNDRIDVALAVDADGAHVGQDDMPTALARQLLGPERILGVSAGMNDLLGQRWGKSSIQLVYRFPHITSPVNDLCSLFSVPPARAVSAQPPHVC